MSLYPDVSNGVPQGPPPSYKEAVGGVYATTPMGFYPPTAPTAPTAPKLPVQGEPPIVTAVVPLGPNSTRTICAHCNSPITTKTKKQPGLIAYISGALIALFGCWLGCCLIPCCIEDCMDIHHTCPECNAYLGKYKKA